MTTEDKRARIAAAMAQFQEVAAKGAPQVAKWSDRHEARAANTDGQAQIVRSVANNPVYLIMSDNRKSEDQKITELADFLTAKDGNYATAREHFAAFEEYFNYAQSETVQVNVKGIQQLVDDLKAGLKPEIEKIVQDLINVQRGIDQSEKLLEVMRKARLEGKTVEEIGSAIEENDRILNEITRINRDISYLGEDENERQERLESQLERKKKSETGLWNGLVRGIMGPDKNIAAAIRTAEAQLEAAKEEVTKTKDQLAAKEAARNASLEDGPLTILRTMDVTEKSFSEQLVKTAETSLSLINGTTDSIKLLMQRTMNGEKSARDILAKLAEGEKRQAVLKGALQQVADRTYTQSQTIKGELDAHDEKILAAGSDVEKAVLRADRVDIAQRHSGLLDYSETLNKTVSNIEAVSASDVEAKSQADQLSALVQSEKELLKRLGLEALPATARALQIVLQTNGVQQTAELSVAISSLTQQARKTGQDSFDKLLQAEGELEDHRLKGMDDAIAALRHAEDAVMKRIESTISNGVEERGRMHGLSAAAEDLTDIVSQLEEIRPTVTAREREEAQATGTGPDRPNAPPVAGAAPTPAAA